jgi:hypothetical protein
MNPLTSIMLNVTWVAALWGYGASWLNEVIKQDSLPKWANTLIADAVVVVAAALATFQTVPTFTLSAFGHALFGAFLAALANHFGFLEPTGIGPKLQSLTSL